MPPKKAASKKEPVPKASSKSASKSTKSTKSAPKAKAPKAEKTSKASKKAVASGPAVADTRRSTRANPSPGLKDRKSGLEKEPSFKKTTIARTAIKNAAAVRDNNAEDSTQRESGSNSHSSESEESRSTSPEVAPPHTSSPMPGAFTADEPSSPQAAGSSKAARISKRTRSQTADDASDADTEDASPSRSSKRVRTERIAADDVPFEYATPFYADPIQQQLALEIEAAPASPSNIHENVSEQLPASTPSALAVINNEESIYHTPQRDEPTQAPEVAEVASVPQVIIHEPAVESHEPEVVAGDQSLAMTTTTPIQPSVNNAASTSKSAFKSASKSASKALVKSSSKPGYMTGPLARPRSPETLAQDLARTRGGRIRKPVASTTYFSARKGKTPERFHLSDMSSSDEEDAVPYTAADMRFVKENSKRMINILQSEKLNKTSMFVLRPDLQAKLEKKFPRKRGDVPNAARHRKKQSPTAVINIHVQTQNGPEVLDVTPSESEALLKIHEYMTDNPGVLTPKEALESVLAAGAAKKALKLASQTSPSVAQVSLSIGTPSQSLPTNNVAVLQTAPNPNSALAPSQQHESDNTGHITDPGDDDVRNQREVDSPSAPPSPKEDHAAESDTEDNAPESPATRASSTGWGFSAMSAIKSVVSKPFVFFGSSKAGPSTADHQDSLVSPSKVPSTPTPASRKRRGLWNKHKSPSANQKGKMKAPILDDSKINEFQAHAQKMKGKQREDAAASRENDVLRHIQSPNKEGTFTVPDASDDDDDDDVEEVNQYTNPTQHTQPVQNTNHVFGNTWSWSNPDRAIQNDQINRNLDFSFAQRKAHRDALDARMVELRAKWAQERAEEVEEERLERERVKEESLNRHHNIKADPEAYREWLERIPLHMDTEFSFRTSGLWDKYHWLVMAAAVEQGQRVGNNKGVRPFSTYQVTDEDKEHLAIWNARRNRVGRFQLEAEAAAKEVADKEAAEKMAKEKEVADQLAAEKDVADKEAAEKEAAEKVVADKLAAEKEVADREAAKKMAVEKEAADKVAAEKETRVLQVISYNEDFEILPRVAALGKAPQRQWADLVALLQ